MRKTVAHISGPALQPPAATKMVKHYSHKDKNANQDKQPVQPNEEIVDRLNDIGKTYPFCVYYRPQSNDPL